MTAQVVAPIHTDFMAGNRETAARMREIADRLERGEFASAYVYAVNRDGTVDEIRSASMHPAQEAGVLMSLALSRLGVQFNER